MDLGHAEKATGRTSRASSTSSLGREVRCGCQYFQSDSLLPERQALIDQMKSVRTPSPIIPPQHQHQHHHHHHQNENENENSQYQGVMIRCSEHEYEPIASPMLTMITPVDGGRVLMGGYQMQLQLQHAPVVRITDTDMTPVADSNDSINDDRGYKILGGDIIIPLDGRIEDSAMEGRELGETTLGDNTSEEQETPQELQERLERNFIPPTITPGSESRTDGEINTSQVDSTTLEELPLRRGARGIPQKLRSQAGKLRTRIRNIQRPTFSFPQRPKKSSSPKSQKSQKSQKSSSSPRSQKSEDSQPKRPSRLERIRSSLPERPKFASKFQLPSRPKFQLPERAKFTMKRPNIKLPTLSRSGTGTGAGTGGKKKAPALKDQQKQYSTESTLGSRRNIFDFSTYPRIFEPKRAENRDYATSSPKEQSRAQSTESSTFPRAKSRSFGGRWIQRFEETAPFPEPESPVGQTVVERAKPWRHPSLEEPRLSIPSEDIFASRIPWEQQQALGGQAQRLEDIRYIESEVESPETSERQDHPDRPEDSDPRLYGDQGVRESFDLESREVSDENSKVQFLPVDPRRFDSEEEEEEEEDEDDDRDEDEDIGSDKEQQSSGSSCDRRRRGVIEEIDSDEFFLREKGISQDDMNFGRSLTREIRDALRSEQPPPVRPRRTKSLRRSKLDKSDEDLSLEQAKHRVVYQAEPEALVLEPLEPLDDIVVVKPVRRRSKTASLRSQSESAQETAPPVVPKRRKRAREVVHLEEEPRRHPQSLGMTTTMMMNGHAEPPVVAAVSSESLKSLEMRMAQQVVEQAPVPEVTPAPAETPVAPKRRSRSRGASIAREDRGSVPPTPGDEDRTSHGAESLLEIEDIPRDDNESLDQTGYAIIERREKPPRPPPPRRRRNKFSTAPRPSPSPPKRPQRAYSTLGPSSRRPRSRTPSETPTTYIEIDSDPESREILRTGEILSKMQGRPLPAPPRPPRKRKEQSPDFPSEVGVSVQTDPLPDDLVIEEEITQAKLVMTPSRAGSQVLVSTSVERIPSPTMFSPPVPPLPARPEEQEEYQYRYRYQQEQQQEEKEEKEEEEVVKMKEMEMEMEMEVRLSRKEEQLLSKKSPQVLPKTPPGTPPEEQVLEDSRNWISRMQVKEEQLPSEEEHPIPEKILQVPPKTPPATPPVSRDPEDLEDSRSQLLRLALLSSSSSPEERLRIPRLEVGDLRVENLSVSQLEARKIAASEIDAIVVSASELAGAPAPAPVPVSAPALPEAAILQELMAIRSQLESVVSSQPPLGEKKTPMIPDEESKPSEEPVDGRERSSRSRSRSGSPVTLRAVRQTASPVRSLPPVISVTPDSPDTAPSSVTLHEVQPQRGVLSYVGSQDREREQEQPRQTERDSPGGRPQFIAFSTSEIPPEFFSLASTPVSVPRTPRRESLLQEDPVPGVLDTSRLLLRALRITGVRAMRHFVRYLGKRLARSDEPVSEEKIREVEVVLCALLLLVAGLIIMYFGNPRVIMHHHHWDYFNPPCLYNDPLP